jgi:hypothetical protein
VVRYRGTWVPGIEGMTRTATDRRPLRYRDFAHVLQPRRVSRWNIVSGYEDRCPPKWAVVPRRCPDHAQWNVHSLKNWIPALPITSAFGYRHFARSTTTGNMIVQGARHSIPAGTSAMKSWCQIFRVRWNS